MTRLLTIAILSWPAVIHAQAYEPRHSFPTGGSEVVLIFVSTSTCTGNSESRLDDVVSHMKVQLRDRVESKGQAFFAVGAAAEWSIEAGIEYLVRGVSPGYTQKSFGSWDELWVGRGWLNNAAVQHMWRGDGQSVVPQLVVLQRSVAMGTEGVEIGTDRVLARIVGSKEIISWYDSGLPFAEESSLVP